MKRRSGFVSNSSSSSYIIAIKDLFESCPTCGRNGNGFLEFLNHEYDINEDNVVKGVGAEHILWSMNINCWMAPDEKLINKVKKYLGDKEWTLAEIGISYHNQKARDDLKELVDIGHVIILDGPND